MTEQIEDRVRQLFRAEVDQLSAPPVDVATVRRRTAYRRRLRVGTSALTVVAVVGAASLTAQALSRHADSRRSGAFAAGAPSAPATQPLVLATPGSNEVTWPYRGPLTFSDTDPVDEAAYAAWARNHALQPNEVVGNPLFGISPVTGTRVLVFEIRALNSRQSNTAVYVEDASSRSISYDSAADPTRPIAVTVTLNGSLYDVVVASPQTATLQYSSDGHHFVSVATLTRMTGTGWAVIPSHTGQKGVVRSATCTTCHATKSTVAP